MKNNIFQMVLAAIGGIFIGLPIAIGSIFTGSCLFILYNGIVMLKFCGLLEMVCFVFFSNLQEKRMKIDIFGYFSPVLLFLYFLMYQLKSKFGQKTLEDIKNQKEKLRFRTFDQLLSVKIKPIVLITATPCAHLENRAKGAIKDLCLSVNGKI